MTNWRLIIQTLKHYWRQNLILALGIAVSTAVLTGSMIVGDSVQYSLKKIVQTRLGLITHTISAGDRFFSNSLATRLEREIKEPVAPLLLQEGMASNAGGKYQIPRVQIVGIDQNFARVSGTSEDWNSLQPGDAFISQNLADRLNLQKNDIILIRVNKLSLIPLNAPFVSNEDLIKPIEVRVIEILPDESIGSFDLHNIQTAPYNIFLSLEFINDMMNTQGKVNYLLISSRMNSEITEMLDRVITLEDINLSINFNEIHSRWQITSDRIFVDRMIQEALQPEPVSALPVLTYFVNNISFAEGATPYSFVSSVPDHTLLQHEIIINKWLAEDLGVGLDDTITLEYFVIGPLRELTEKSDWFIVKQIVPLAGKWADKTLMPNIPGLSDMGNCRDWETGIPINLDRIRSEDEDYWDENQGLPKAFISYSSARQLWSNRFGESTILQMPDQGTSADHIAERILERIQPEQFGFQLKDVRKQGDLAAGESVNFSQLFLGLSSFLLLAGILLIVLLFSLNTTTRMSHIGTLSFLGFTHQKIKTLWLVEGLLVSVTGAIAGLFLAIGYNQVIFKALNSIWSDIVRTPALETDINLQTLAIGFSISVAISSLAIFISTQFLLKESSHQLQTHTLAPTKNRVKVIKSTVMILSGISALVLIIWSSFQSSSQNPAVFFVSGALILTSLLLLVNRTFEANKQKLDLPYLRLQDFLMRNLTAKSRQNFLVVSMFAIATFIVITTGAHRKNLFTEDLEKTGGTGGFLFYGESTLPILNNLNDPQVRFLSGLKENIQMVQFREYPGDDASCLNLNRTRTPGILGIEPNELKGRFHFISRAPELDRESPWNSLEGQTQNNIIPAIADQSVIQWGLGLRVGDTLQYLNEYGEVLYLKLIGGLANSIFQGNVLISNEHFLLHFPSHSGSNVFLLEGNPDARERIAIELRAGLRDHGLNLESTAERLATFNSVENTYLTIFLILGGLGLIIGTLGLAVVLARNLLNRKKELGIMRATGFTNTLILKIIAQEHIYLLFVGISIGMLSATLANVPSWLDPNPEVSVSLILILIMITILNGIFWIILITTRFLKGGEVVNALRSE